MESVRNPVCVSILALALSPVWVWAADPVVPGVPNFHAVNGHIYRGGQPTQRGYASLAQLGVTTVIDLRRGDGSSINAERSEVEAAGMRYVSVPMKQFGAPSDEQIAGVLDLLNTNERVFVHCRRGKDRTGTAIACYRIAHDHWDNRRALKEAESYGMSIFERGMKHYILQYKPSGGGEPDPPCQDQ